MILERGSRVMAVEYEALLAEAFPGKEHLFFSPMVIGENPAEADNGAAAILAGTKTATSAAFWDFPDGRIPFVGALSVLLDGRKIARAILETERVDIIPFSAADEALAHAYGEWDLTLTTWRSRSRAWYEISAARHGETFTDETPIICEWFRVLRTLKT
jgi:uncharacterized protein YhfF